MNDKTNFIGYSQNIGLTSNSSTTLTTNCNGTVNTYIDGNWATPLNGGNNLIYSNGSDYNSISTAIANSNNMRTQQVHVAVFTVERNDKNEINSTKFVKELWVEQKNGTSIDLLVAKQLDKDFDPETTIIKVLSTVSF